MALTRRLRFEILRRDKHTCFYCGRKAPDVELQVDHVIPTALGGTDEPTNLVAACTDCNSGKTSLPPDAPTVEAVSGRALLWAAAIVEAGAWMATDRGLIVDARLCLDDTWNKYGYTGRGGKITPFYRPDDWPLSVTQWKRRGLTSHELIDLVEDCMLRQGVQDRWTYLCGMVWRFLDEKQERALDIIETDPSTWLTQQV